MIIASVFLGVILGAILTRPRRWDLHICVDDPVDHVRVDTASDRHG
ncbi:hypothetical protein [Streptosporangium sp. NPDC048865]